MLYHQWFFITLWLKSCRIKENWLLFLLHKLYLPFSSVRHYGFFFFSHHFLHPTNLCREHFSFLLFSKVVCAISRVHKPYLHSTTVFLCWLLFFGKLINLKAYGQVLRQHNLVGMWFFPLHFLPFSIDKVLDKKKKRMELAHKNEYITHKKLLGFFFSSLLTIIFLACGSYFYSV